ncbi:Uncharacterised protein [Vibrio cholerae]|nr:Uncharacterised protein [Vibrio cholerae]
MRIQPSAFVTRSKCHIARPKRDSAKMTNKANTAQTIG